MVTESYLTNEAKTDIKNMLDISEQGGGGDSGDDKNKKIKYTMHFDEMTMNDTTHNMYIYFLYNPHVDAVNNILNTYFPDMSEDVPIKVDVVWDYTTNKTQGSPAVINMGFFNVIDNFSTERTLKGFTNCMLYSNKACVSLYSISGGGSTLYNVDVTLIFSYLYK